MTIKTLDDALADLSPADQHFPVQVYRAEVEENGVTIA